jgi:hypothetical protein
MPLEADMRSMGTKTAKGDTTKMVKDRRSHMKRRERQKKIEIRRKERSK